MPGFICNPKVIPNLCCWIFIVCSMTACTVRMANEDGRPEMASMPERLTIEFSHATSLMADGKTEQAKALLIQLNTEFPAYAGAAINLALLSEPVSLHEAMTWLEVALARQPDNHLIYDHLGRVSRKQHEYNQAQRYYEKAIELKPDYAESWYNLAILNEVYRGDYSRAIQAYQQYLKLSDNNDEKNITRRIKRMEKEQ